MTTAPPAALAPAQRAAIRESERERLHDEARVFVRTTVEAWDHVPSEPEIQGAIEKVYRVLCQYSRVLRGAR